MRAHFRSTSAALLLVLAGASCAKGSSFTGSGTGSASPVCMEYCEANSITSCSGGLTCYGLQDENSHPIVLGGASVGVRYF